MNQGSLTERITRSLAYMLRHQPEEFDLELDPQGYGDLEDVVHALNERLGEPVEEEDVVEAIEAGDRARYEIVDDRIRALYGHSITIDPGEGCEPPDLLYVGVGSRDADRAERHGLESGRRAFLHLALTYEDAQETGKRIAEEYAVVTVNAIEAWEDGINFYDRGALYLSESIPTEFLEVGDLHDDGFERPHRGRGGRDGGRGRGRDRGPRGRGGRRGGRGRYREDDEEPRGRRDDRRDDDDRGSRGRGRDSDRPSRKPHEESRGPVRANVKKKPEREPEKVVEQEAAPTSAADGFGDGIFEPKKAPAKKRKKAAGKKKAAKKKAAEAAPAEESSSPPSDDGGGFGLGVF